MSWRDKFDSFLKNSFEKISTNNSNKKEEFGKTILFRDYGELMVELNRLQNKWSNFKFYYTKVDNLNYCIEFSVKKDKMGLNLNELFEGLNEDNFEWSKTKQGENVIVDVTLDGYASKNDFNEFLYNHPQFSEFELNLKNNS